MCNCLLVIILPVVWIDQTFACAYDRPPYPAGYSPTGIN